MRILITLGRNPDSCAEVIWAAGSFPWPAGTLFSVLTVAEVVPPTPAIELAPVAADVTDIQRDADAEAQTIAASAAAELRGRGFYADGIAKEGDPASVIVDHAKEWRADLILIGSCDKSRIEKLFAGSVSESVLKHAPCSVLVVKSGTHGIP